MQVVGAAGGEQEAADSRDAATSVGGLITPRQEHQQDSAPHPGQGSMGGSGAKPHGTSPDHPRGTAAAAAAAAGDNAAGEAGLRRSSSNVGAGSAAGTRRGSRYNTTDSISSMDKLHALYARFNSDCASQRPSSTGDLALPSSSATGRQSRRATGTGPSISSVAAAAAASNPMRSSLPYPVAALATARQSSGGRGERRCRSVSPQKAPSLRQAHALNQDTLQHHQEAHRQHGCARQLQHSVSLCSSCGGPLQRGASCNSRAGSAATQTFDAASPAALPSKGLATITGSSGAGGVGTHTSSDALPSTHISLSALMAGGGLSADAARWERPVQQLTTVPEPSSPAAHSGTVPDAQGPGEGASCSTGGPVGREDAAALRASGTRSAYSASPVRGTQGVTAGGYRDRSPRAATLITSAVAARRAASHSPGRQRGVQRAAFPAAGHSDIILSKEGVGLATLSFGQLLQETAVEQALGQLQQDVASSLHNTPRTSPNRAAAASPAGACGTDALAAGAAAAQDAGSLLQVVPEEGVVVGPATKTQPAPCRTHSISNSRRHLTLSSPQEVSPCHNPDLATPCSPAAAAAAAALKQLAQSTARDELQQHAQSLPRTLSHCSSMQDADHGASRRSSSAEHRRCLTATSSMRSHTSALSAGSSKVWRPGGNRTDPKDDCRKLQTYESARLRALLKQGLLSPGCSTRHEVPGDETTEGIIGSVSPKSRRSTANDLATPVSPGPPSHFGSAPASPSYAASPGGYAAAASARRKMSLTATPAAAGAAASPSPRQARSAGRPASAPAARAAAVRAVGSKSVLEPAHTSVFLADLANGSPPGPQRSASPNMYTKPQRKASPHSAQQDGSVLGSASPGKPARQHTQPQRAGISPSRSARKQTYASTAPQAASARPHSAGHTLQPLGGSRRAPSSGNSTTAQVEEAIRAAQAALLEKKRQVSQVRQALSLMRGSACSSRGYSKQAAASPGTQAYVEDDGMASIRDSSSIWGDSSCTSSYRGGRISKDLAAAFAAVTASQGAAGQPQGNSSTPHACDALLASADPAYPAVVDTHGEAHSAGGSLGLDNAHKHDAAPESVAAAELTGAPAFQEAPAGSAYTVMTVQASSTATQPSGRAPAAMAELAASSSQQAVAAGALFAAPSATRSPVQQQGRHKSRNPKRRPVSALEALLGLTPEDAEDSPQQQPVRPSSAQPVMSSLAALSPRGRSASPVSAAKRAAAHAGASSSARKGKTGPQLGVQAGGVAGSKVQGTSSAARRSSGGGSGGGCIAEPWSVPRRRSSAGLTGEQLMELHRRRSAAEAAEAAAAAAEGDTEAAECCEHTMPLDVLVRAYTALNKKNKNSSERVAAVAMLLNHITEGPAAHAGASQSGSPDAAQASPPAHHGADNSPAAEQPQHKLRSSPSPGADGIRLDVLGRGLGLCLPDSPMGPSSTLGLANGPPSPSAIIQTLKADSLSSWHRTSPERQAAHASLLATPKHKQASSYAADLAALAAASSSSNLYAERSVHNKADSSPASAGKQQQQPGGTPADAPAADVPVAGEFGLSPPQTRHGSVSGAAPRGCTPLRNVRLSNSQSGAAPDVGHAHLQTQELPLPTQPEEALELANAAPAPCKPMVDTATGRLVLDSIGAHDMTVSAALTWLKAGLQTPEQAQTQAAAAAARAAAASPGPRSPKRLGHSRPCSAFSCFGGNSRAMARSSDGSEGAGGSPGQQQQAPQQQQEVEQGASADGVTFQMGADNRLVMVIQQPGTAGPQRLQVTGIRLHPEAGVAAGHGNAAASGGAEAAGSSAHVLDLITDGGSHTIELASESDWAGLVVGLNSMLLLLEQQEPQVVEQLGAIPMGQVAWSTAVLGLGDV